MKTRNLIAAVVAAGFMAMSAPLLCAEQAAGSAATKSEPIYGYRMMNDAERNEYREKMRNARSEGERQALRDEHHKRMQERGMGPGQGMGPRGEGRGPGAGGRGPCAAGAECPGPGPGAGQGRGPRGEGKGPGYGPGGRGPCAAGEECPGPGAGQGRGPRGEGKGPSYGKGPRGDCPAGQDCPGTGRGPATKP